MGKQLPTGEDQQDRSVDELSSRLSDGLRCCHTLVSNYRALLRSAGPPPQPGNDRFAYPTSEDLVSDDR